MGRISPGLLCAALYLVLTGWMTLTAPVAPSVVDGNETFSSLLHARNTIMFGVEGTYGLADEATALLPEAHPVPHTHQGNFPRLYATALAYVGIDAPRSQVLIHLWTIGLATFLLFLSVAKKLMFREAALFAALFFATDYVFTLQWHVVTYRVWQDFMIVGAAFCALHYQPTAKLLLVFIAFLSFGLFYNELIFAFFCSLFAALLVLMRTTVRWRDKFLFYGAQAVGGFSALGLLTTQLIAFYGWDGFVRDITVTFTTRNAADFAANEPPEALRQFVEETAIAFFYNAVDGAAFRTVPGFLDTLFRWGLGYYSQALCLVAGLVIVLMLANRLRPWWGAVGRAACKPGFIILTGLGASLLLLAPKGPSVMAVAILLTGTLAYVTSAGRRKRHLEIDLPVLAAVAVIVPVATALLPALLPVDVLIDFFLGTWGGSVALLTAASTVSIFAVAQMLAGAGPVAARRVSAESVGGVMLFLLLSLGLTACLQMLFPESGAPARLQRTLMGNWGSSLLGLAPALVLVSGILLSVRVPPSSLGDAAGELRRAILTRFILAFLVAWVVIFVLSPGYVYSGYMWRIQNPLHVLFALFLGAAAGAAFAWGRQLCRLRAARLTASIVPAATPAVVVLATLLGAWTAVQGTYMRAVPSDGFEVLAALERIGIGPEEGIASNNYAASYALVAGTWGYLDHELGAWQVTFDEEGYHVASDKRYLWLRDRGENPIYKHPRYYVCHMPLSLTDAWFFGESRPRCGDVRVVALAAASDGGDHWPSHELIARDDSAQDRWAVVRLDWDMPPYLAEQPRVEAPEDGLRVLYNIRIQDGVSEGLSEARLFEVTSVGGGCTLETMVARVAGKGGKIRFAVKPSPDTLLVVKLVPASETKRGEAGLSEPFTISADGVVTQSKACAFWSAISRQ